MNKKIYLVLAILGAILPSTQFVPWAYVNGFNLIKMVEAMFANQIASGIAIDALSAASFLVIFIILEQPRVKARLLFIPIIGIFIFGLAFAFPFYLFLRERALEQTNQPVVHEN